MPTSADVVLPAFPSVQELHEDVIRKEIAYLAAAFPSVEDLNEAWGFEEPDYLYPAIPIV